jgi:hypothetical protein
MALVERVTGIEVQSYETDPRLLGELRGSWPPADDARDGSDGYRSTAPLATLRVRFGRGPRRC